MGDHGGKEDEKELGGLYGAVQGAIWLLGIGLLIWTGWWIPGIFILIAISGITQALLMRMAKQDEAKAQVADSARQAALAVPPNCPTCGAAISAQAVTWTGPTTAACPYCKAAIPLDLSKTKAA